METNTKDMLVKAKQAELEAKAKVQEIKAQVDRLAANMQREYDAQVSAKQKLDYNNSKFKHDKESVVRLAAFLLALANGEQVTPEQYRIKEVIDSLPGLRKCAGADKTQIEIDNNVPKEHSLQHSYFRQAALKKLNLTESDLV